MDYSANRIYTFADYLQIGDSWVELIKGKLVKMSPMPSVRHQQVSGRLFYLIFGFLKDRECQVFHPPFDVRLPGVSHKNEEILTVVQPDVTVVCDSSKLDEQGCLGPPDWIIEVLSKGNARRDTHDKLRLYEEAGVKEYWIVHPIEETIICYQPDSNGQYRGSVPYTRGDRVVVQALPGLEIDVNEVFADRPTTQ